MRRFGTFTLLATLAAQSLGQRSAFDHERKPERARVHIIAASYRILHGMSGGQDAYLAEVQMRGHADLEALLLDSFQEPSIAIDQTVLAENRPLDMLVIRDPQCDRRFSEMVYPRRGEDVYEPGLLRKIDRGPEAVLPCYRALHESIRLAKH